MHSLNKAGMGDEVEGRWDDLGAIVPQDCKLSTIYRMEVVGWSGISKNRAEHAFCIWGAVDTMPVWF